MSQSDVHRRFHGYVAAVNVAGVISRDVVLRAYDQYLSDLDAVDLPYELRAEWETVVTRFLSSDHKAIPDITAFSEIELREFHSSLKALGHKLHDRVGVWTDSWRPVG